MLIEKARFLFGDCDNTARNNAVAIIGAASISFLSASISLSIGSILVTANIFWPT